VTRDIHIVNNNNNNNNNNKISWHIYNHMQQQKSLLSTLHLHRRASDKLSVFVLIKLHWENAQPFYTGSGRNTWRFGNTAVSGIGVGNLSLSAPLARLKASQLPWSAGLYCMGHSLWRLISKQRLCCCDSAVISWALSFSSERQCP
jgi:hypothetical protein